jgi:multiple sugar transport system permease protein/putative aldouronate transport system permease protein
MSNKPDLYTLQYRLYIYLQTSNNLAELMRGGQISQAALNAALNARTVKLTVAMITIIPILLVYPFMSRYFEKGIMIGAVKG